MLVLTNGLAWLSPFSAWFIWVPAGLFVVLLLIEVFFNRSGKWGVFGALSMTCFFVGLVLGIFYVIMGSPPHGDILKNDISSQAMIKDFRWSDFPRFIGQNSKGELVKCTYFATDVPNVVQVVCDK